MSLTYSDV